MKTNLNPVPEMEDNPVILARIAGEVQKGREEYNATLARIKDASEATA